MRQLRRNVTDRVDFDIFCHAGPVEASFSPRLAQLKYLLPRLVGQNSCSAVRQGECSGGPGESQLTELT